MEEAFDQLADALAAVTDRAREARQFPAHEYAYILAAGKIDEAASAARAILDRMIVEARRA